MTLKLDNLDVAILRVLSEDGRISLRQLAKTVNSTTPTVHARLKRMRRIGLLSKIAPIYNVDKLNKGTGALLWLKVESSYLPNVMPIIKKFQEVKSIFITTGEANVLLKIYGKNYDTIQSISDEVEAQEGVRLVSTQIITKTLKDEQGVVIAPDIGILLTCDYCKGMIKGDPVLLKILEGERFFCCKTCLAAYKAKYKSRIKI